MRRSLGVVVGVITFVSPLAGSPADAATGHPEGGCPTAGGWVVDDYASDNGSAILVDQVYGNDNGLLCVKSPGNAPYPMLIDDVVPAAAQR